jgi:hypothetical protein
MIDSGRRSDPGGLGGATRPLLMDARRYGVRAPLRWTPAGGGPFGPPNPRGRSPSSPFLVSTKNLCRGQPVSGCDHRFSVTTFIGAESCPCFDRVTMNNSGLNSAWRAARMGREYHRGSESYLRSLIDESEVPSEIPQGERPCTVMRGGSLAVAGVIRKETRRRAECRNS